MSEKFTEVSEYISQHYQEDLSVAELAENAGVRSTTVMRLVQLRGFDSYTTFKKALAQESLLKKYNAVPQPAAGIFPYLGDGEPGYVPYGDRGRNPGA